MRIGNGLRFGVRLIGVWFILFLCPVVGLGTVMMPDDARKAVSTWIERQDVRLGNTLSGKILAVEPVYNDNQELIYYIVSLDPTGLVIVPAEDGVEPIVAVFPNATQGDLAADSPMQTLLRKDLSERVRAAKATGSISANAKTVAGTETSAREKWSTLLGHTTVADRTAKKADISDVRVSPLTQTLWNQGSLDAGDTVLCYNYYTPRNYLSGCVATAMAQLMRYHQYPTAGIGIKKYAILVDRFVQTVPTRGGDGAGGPYAWDQMIADPSGAYSGGTLTTAQQQAIGDLCYDAGIAVNTEYGSNGSGANTEKDATALTQTFSYGQAISAQNTSGLSTATLTTALNSNLDAGLPCILGLLNQSPSGGGHSAVCDGYGYDLGTLYHHLNLGWSGRGNVWYNLPMIDVDTNEIYNGIPVCIYNVFPHGTGEIISGRITDQNGYPISGVVVTAASTAKSFTATATTNAKGIYAITGAPSATAVTLTPVKDGWPIDPRTVTTGTSATGTTQVGNLWGGSCDFTAGPGTKLTLSVTVSPSSDAGTVQISPNQTYYTQGTVVTLTATPADKYRISSWSGTDNDGSVETTNTVTLNQNKAVTVTFEPTSKPCGSCGGAGLLLIGLFLSLSPVLRTRS